MGQNNGCRFCVSKTLLIFIGVILGIVNAYLWFLGYIDFVKATLPYAIAVGLVILIITTVLKAKCCNTSGRHDDEDCHLCSTCLCVSKYSTIVFIATIIMLIISLIILATNLSVIIKFILALLGSVSFWTTILTFATMVYCICFKRRC